MGKVINSGFFDKKSSDSSEKIVVKRPVDKKAVKKETVPAEVKDIGSVSAENIPSEVSPADTEKVKVSPEKVRAKKAETAGDVSSKAVLPKSVKEKAETQTESKSTVFENKKAIPVRINSKLLKDLKGSTEILRKFGRENSAAQLENIYARGTRKKFSVAVVGEFSKGKSTFINELLGREILPVGNMPTTALLTRIKYANKEQMVHFKGNGKKKELPLKESSWDGLVAENFGEADPTGFVVAGIRSQWLGENNIEIIDTPGAGDLEEKRARSIGDALLGCDCAIITISATAALSQTEKLFIEQRLISKKTPFLMLIVTKLDMVRERERESIIDYIKDKLSAWNMDIPVFIPGTVSMSGDKYNDIIGYDKIMVQIGKWINDPERIKLTETWIRAQAAEVFEREMAFFAEQKTLLEADEKKREELIAEKKQHIDNSDVVWGELRTKMMERCAECTDAFANKINELTDPMIEKLKYEVSHSSDIERWWREDYPYRLKVEITNMSVATENHVSRIISEDIRWFNTSLEKQFKVHVDVEKETIIDKSIADNISETGDVGIKNLERRKRAVKIGTTVASLAGATVLGIVTAGAAAGVPVSLFATMGIGTGSSIVSDIVFKKKIQEQRDSIKNALSSIVPSVIKEAVHGSDAKIRRLYDEIISATKEKEIAWKEMQKEAIEAGLVSKNQAQHNNIDEKIVMLADYSNRIVSGK